MPAEPTEVSPIAMAADETWPKLLAHLPEYASAVLTGLDAQGYPYSVRCHPQLDGATRTVRIAATPGASLQPGVASLLCHRHDEHLWHQYSFLVRGHVARADAGWIFQPQQYIEGVGYGGLLGMVRFVIGARRAATAYLAKRGLPRPSIPWDQVLAAKQQAQLPAPAVLPRRWMLVAGIGVLCLLSLLATMGIARRRMVPLSHHRI